MRSHTYEFTCAGRLSPFTASALGAHIEHADSSETRLSAELRDAAELHGFIAQIEALGIELVGLHRQGGSHAPEDGPTVGRDEHGAGESRP